MCHYKNFKNKRPGDEVVKGLDCSKECSRCACWVFLALFLLLVGSGPKRSMQIEKLGSRSLVSSIFQRERKLYCSFWKRFSLIKVMQSFLNPLTFSSDWYVISPYNINTLSSKQIMRILLSYQTFWCVVSLSIFTSSSVFRRACRASQNTNNE